MVRYWSGSGYDLQDHEIVVGFNEDLLGRLEGTSPSS